MGFADFSHMLIGPWELSAVIGLALLVAVGRIRTDDGK